MNKNHFVPALFLVLVSLEILIKVHNVIFQSSAVRKLSYTTCLSGLTGQCLCYICIVVLHVFELFNFFDGMQKSVDFARSHSDIDMRHSLDGPALASEGSSSLQVSRQPLFHPFISSVSPLDDRGRSIQRERLIHSWMALYPCSPFHNIKIQSGQAHLSSV